MSSVFSFLVPRDKKFFPLFERSADNLKAISVKLVDLLAAEPANQRSIIKEIEHLEHEGDGIAHEIFNELGKSFITPFDREDIHALASALDDVVDYIHGSAKRIELYHLKSVTTEMIKLGDLINKGAEELCIAIKGLKDMKNAHKIREAAVRINSIENHADDIFDMAVADLFENETDAKELIKKKEILAVLETATDKCEDAADVISSIVIKYN